MAAQDRELLNLLRMGARVTFPDRTYIQGVPEEKKIVVGRLVPVQHGAQSGEWFSQPDGDAWYLDSMGAYGAWLHRQHLAKERT